MRCQLNYEYVLVVTYNFTTTHLYIIMPLTVVYKLVIMVINGKYGTSLTFFLCIYV
jgi:hypothetical protein